MSESDCLVCGNGKMSRCRTTASCRPYSGVVGGGTLLCFTAVVTNEEDNMKTENNNRKRRIYVRLTDKEFRNLEARFKNTTCRSVSEYVRHCLFNRQITTITRDASADEVITQISHLNRALNAIGSNFNQLVRKVNATSQAAEIKGLLLLFESQKKAMFSKIDEVKEQLQKLAERWLQ